MNEELITWIKGIKIRKVSSKWDVVRLVLFIIICLVIPFPEKTNSVFQVEVVEFLSMVVFVCAKICSMVGIVCEFVSMYLNFKTNKYLQNLPYAFDYELELSTYKNIGLKKTKGKIKIEKFERYTKWKEYILLKYKILMNNEDFYRFLNRTLKNKRTAKEMLIGLVTPVEVGILTTFFSVNSGMGEMEIMLSLIVLALVIVVVVLYGILDTKNEIEFIEDFVEIIFPDKTKKMCNIFDEKERL